MGRDYTLTRGATILRHLLPSDETAGMMTGQFVVYGSVFILASVMNPTNPLQAFALRAAGHLPERLLI